MNLHFLSPELRSLIEMALTSHAAGHPGRFWDCGQCEDLRDDFEESILIDLKVFAAQAVSA